jgi:hypothetical protein
MLSFILLQRSVLNLNLIWKPFLPFFYWLSFVFVEMPENYLLPEEEVVPVLPGHPDRDL